MPLAVYALTAGAFGIGTTEFVIMGLLLQVSADLGISVPLAGLLMTGYALGVFDGAPVLTIATRSLPRKTTLLVLMAIFTLGNLLSALAPGYWTLLAARLVTSLNHGAFFGLGAVVAASVVPKDHQASAVAAMFMGLTIANIGGVPAATWIGQQIGWRMAFAGTAALGVIAIIALWIALPKGEPGQPVNVRRELRVLARPEVVVSILITMLGFSGTFALYTYVAPLLEDMAGASGSFVTLALALIGIGFTIGNWLGGKLADWSPEGATAIFLVSMVVIMLAMPFLLTNQISAAITLLVWGIAAFAIVPPVQTRVMQAASDAPGLASSVNIGAFNLGNAIGAAIGGAVIAMGYGYAAVPVAGALLAVAALSLVLIARRQNVEPNSLHGA